MAPETVHPIDCSHPPPSWAVLPERQVHSINRCNISGTRTCNRSMRGNHLAYAATQGIIIKHSIVRLKHCTVANTIMYCWVAKNVKPRLQYVYKEHMINENHIAVKNVCTKNKFGNDPLTHPHRSNLWSLWIIGSLELCNNYRTKNIFIFHWWMIYN